MSASRPNAPNKNPNIVVTVRIRPPSDFEKGNKDSMLSVKCMDERVVIFDPADLNKPQHRGPQGVRRGKDIPFGFDRVFDQYATQYEVFQHTTQPLVAEVLNGYNCACFAYGATGAGKTFTMVGTETTPGVMVLTLQELFSTMKANQDDKKYSVRISYLEVYNENIHDLLVPHSKPLALLESGDTMTVLGLTQHEPQSADEVLLLLQEGNTRRAQNFTHANAESSRSHAVLQVMVEQRDRTANVTAGVRTAKFSLIDLAGSERASRTKNQGKQLVEGANINRSLLALGNCINALGNGYTEGKYVPYRDSKLTRLLKDSLGGNCKTVMVSNISPSTLSYEDTFNTLQYANRAKNIKTKVRANEINLVMHVSEYKDIIADLRKEVEEWRSKCSKYEAQLEEEGRSKQAAIDLEYEEHLSGITGGDHSSTSSAPLNPTYGTPTLSSKRLQVSNRTGNGDQNMPGPTPSSSSVCLPILSRTVSMGLQTPRNSKTEKRLLNISSEIDDLVTDRRNVQKHLEDVNIAISDLLAQREKLQDSPPSYAILSQPANLCESAPCSGSPKSPCFDSSVPTSPTVVSHSNTDEALLTGNMLLVTPAKAQRAPVSSPQFLQWRKDLDVILRKLEEHHSLRDTLLKRLGRNAESCKRIQTEMSAITPHAEDADLFRHLKLELVINVLEITNFSRALQEDQLTYALTAAFSRWSRAEDVIQSLRSALSEYGYEEPADLRNKMEQLAVVTPREPQVMASVDLPSPFAVRSPRTASPGVPALEFAASSSDPKGVTDYQVPSTPSRFSVTIKKPNNSIPVAPFTSRQPITAQSKSVSTIAANRPPKPAITTQTTGRTPIQNASQHVRVASHPQQQSSKKPTTTSSLAKKAASTASTNSLSASATANAAAPSTVSNSGKPTLGQAKRVAQRVAVTTKAPSVTTSGQNQKPDTKLSQRYRSDPAVAKALASFKPAFQPRDERQSVASGNNTRAKSTPTTRIQEESSSPSSTTSPSSAFLTKGVSQMAAENMDQNKSPNRSESSNEENTNPLAILLASSVPSLASSSASSYAPLDFMAPLSKPPTTGTQYSSAAPISYSPLMSSNFAGKASIGEEQPLSMKL